MGKKVDLGKSKALFSRRVEFDLPKKMSEIRELRKALRLAEMASATSQAFRDLNGRRTRELNDPRLFRAAK